MKVKAIVIKNNPISEQGFANLVESSKRVGNEFTIERFDAFTPDDVSDNMRWTWPWSGSEFDMTIGVRKVAYQTANPKARMACFMSHAALWSSASYYKENLLILEHDAYFINKLPTDIKLPSTPFCMSINDPRGCTRRAAVYDDMLQRQAWAKEIVQAPWIDNQNVVQGLPGNSAYIVSPEFGIEAINKHLEIGAWPNDALLCKQLFPGKIWCSTKYYTTVQRLPSTTTG